MIWSETMPLLGQRVILNPEERGWSDFEHRRQFTAIITEVDQRILRKWDELIGEPKGETAATVMWEDGKPVPGYSHARLKWFFPIDGSYVDLRRLKFDDGQRLFNTVDYVEKQLDYYIIENGLRIMEDTLYGEAYREELLNQGLSTEERVIRGLKAKKSLALPWDEEEEKLTF